MDSYLTDEITARAIDFIRRKAKGPFFVDVAYNATHWPLQPAGLSRQHQEWTKSVAVHMPAAAPE